jgi:hypothetical protein
VPTYLVCHLYRQAKDGGGCRPKYEIPPSLANVPELIPPFFTVLSLPSGENVTVILISVKRGRSIETEDIKKRIIVQDMFRRSAFQRPVTREL